ncbi:hypothetical protein [Frankia sp. Cppng1_Ct_nod]|uniref:hypothetical protein n=1 Tax=Frankia sp. Cppng1_Ct_nod TaxID=2897162 RepID=UPI0010417D5E|nr:hypothetical protein [Frankia sp. Cppng1_Ct_nod]
MDARTWIVDAANVIGARPDGWWRDRAAAALRLHQRLSGFCAGTYVPRTPGGPEPPDRVVLVLEGTARAGVAAGPDTDTTRLVVIHATGSGDDAVIDQIHRQPGPVFVITADRELRGRAQAAGATVVRPGWLWAVLDDTGPV